MISRRSSYVAFAALTIAARPLAAQSTSSAQLPAPLDSTLHAIFAGPTLVPERFGPARWTASGDSYATLERSPSGGTDVVEYDAATGTRRVRVSAAQLTPAGRTTPLDVDDYAWSQDGTRLLVFTNTRKVWRQNTRGDYWVLDLRANRLRQVGGDAVGKEPSLMFAKFSPDGSRVGYVRDGDVYVERVDDGAITRITKDASRTVVNGMTDWVYEEEFDLRDAFRWSPDGQAIAFWQFDMSGIRDFFLINDTDSLYPVITPVQYPKAGTTNSAVRLGIARVDGSAPITWVKLDGDPRQHYIPRAEWAGSDTVVLQYMNRLQQRDDLVFADARTGTSRIALTETDSAWIDVVDDMTWLRGGREFLWVSERDGWRHAYRVSRDGRTMTLVTPGAYDVVGIAAVDESAGVLYVIASPTNATQRYLYRVSLTKPGAPVRMSPADAPGTHTYAVSPNARWALHTYSRMDVPSVTDVVALPSHRVARTLVRNDALRAAAAPYLASPTEFFQVPVGNGVTLDGWMVKPQNFDASRRYPLLVHVYGEPASQTVVDRWGGGQMLWHRTLANLGYVVMSVDVRGTPAPKGRAWRKIVYGALGPLSSREEAEAVKAVTRARPYLDSTRVAIWGWSGGGSNTLNAMFRYPDVYKVGMSVAPVPDQHLYDTIYQERYMGIPTGPGDGYMRGSPIEFAAGLRGKLLVVHGSGDDNVHYQGTERLVNRLVTLGKPFDLMVYPNRSHCICEGTGTTLHVYSLLTRYLLTNLPPAAPAGLPQDR